MFWVVPRSVNILFTGRSELLSRIESEFRNNNAGTTEQKRLVITGVGGIGKSEVCLRAAKLLRDECVTALLCYLLPHLLTVHSFDGVFWVDVSSPPTAISGFQAIAEELGLHDESIGASLHMLAKLQRRWLLLLDNANDPEFDYSAYIPSGTQGAVIMTSRIPECSRYSTLPVEVLEGLEEEHSIQLLLKAARVPKTSLHSSKEQAEAIVQLLGSHTLALIQAGAYIAEGHCQLDQYAENYKQLRTRLLENNPTQQQSKYQHVYVTFKALVEALNNSHDEMGQDALDLLGVLSMMHSSMVPLEIFQDTWKGARCILEDDDDQRDEAGTLRQWHVCQLPEFIPTQADKWDYQRLDNAINLLTSLSLLKRGLVDGVEGLSFHPLVHEWARDRLHQEQQQTAWVRAGCILALSWNQSETRKEYESHLRPHLHAFLSLRTNKILSFGPPGTILPILLRCGWVLNKMREGNLLALVIRDMYGALGIEPSDPSREHIQICNLDAINLCRPDHTEQALRLLKHDFKVSEVLLTDGDNYSLVLGYTFANEYLIGGQKNMAGALLESLVKSAETMLSKTNISLLVEPHQDADNTTIAASTRYRLYWGCVGLPIDIQLAFVANIILQNCGHVGYDDFEETIPGAVARLADLLRVNGVRSRVKLRLSHHRGLWMYRLCLLIWNVVHHHIKALGILPKVFMLPFKIMGLFIKAVGLYFEVLRLFFEAVSTLSTSHSATPVPVGPSGQSNPLPVASGGQNTAQSTNPVPNIVYHPNGAPVTTQAVATQYQQPPPSPRNDYMLLCAHDQRWLATREDLDVAQIKSDRQLSTHSRTGLTSGKAGFAGPSA